MSMTFFIKLTETNDDLIEGVSKRTFHSNLKYKKSTYFKIEFLIDDYNELIKFFIEILKLLYIIYI